MLYLAFVFHNHQPYYKNLLTNTTDLPWVRLHGSKDYVDMVEILEKYPKIHQTFNLVPSLLEQVEDFVSGNVKDLWLELSYKPADQLTHEDKAFIRERFFSINKEKAIAMLPRYYELFFKSQRGVELTAQDYLDLQVMFNLAWIDPMYRQGIPELAAVMGKGRFFSEEDKKTVLSKQLEILKKMVPVYARYMEKGQLEVIVNPYYHPILPLLVNTRIAKEANVKSPLPREQFAFPQDALAQINDAVAFYRQRFGVPPAGMWPSEEAVSEHILPFIINAGVKWIVADEGILFRSLRAKKRDTALLYQPHLLRRKDGDLAIVFRDRNLSDMIGFTYHSLPAKVAVDDFMFHLENTAKAFEGRDILVTIAMDGENAWEYYANDGHDFLNMLYQRLSDAPFVQTTTVCEYLRTHPATHEIRRLAAGSWIYSEFGKWIGNAQKVKAWEYLVKARKEFQELLNDNARKEALGDKLALAWKQMYICEGSDWFWWYGDNQADFDKLYRTHLTNFYTIIGKEPPEYLKYPI